MRLADLDLRAELGRGAQGVVYRALDPSSGKEVAVKCFHPRGRAELSMVERLRGEVASALGPRLDGVCSVRAAGFDEGTPFVVMDLVEGPTLKDLLRCARRQDAAAATSPSLPGDARRRARWATRCVERLARSLHAAHERGLVHGDLKPSNVILRGAEEPVLLDLGLAALSVDGTPRAATLSHAAPEQLAPDGRPDRRTDVHGLGVLLHELLTLEHPFAAPTATRAVEAIASRDARLSSRWCRIVGRDLAAVLERALEKDPGRRYPTALALAEDLAAVLRGAPVTARRAGLGRRLTRWGRGHRKLALVGGMLVVALLGLGALELLEARSVERSRAEIARRADLLLAPRLLAGEREGRWVVLPRGLAGLRDWQEQADRIVGRQEVTSLPAGVHEQLAAARRRVARRIDDARTLRERTVERQADVWSATLEELGDPYRSPQYSGLRLPPQTGLVPLGRDPLSGLFEFAHVQSGAPPERGGPDRAVRVDGAAAIVFVLVPGGTFTMGAAPDAPGTPPRAPNVDPSALPSESPLHEVTLEPFLIAKHELTLGQWTALGGELPIAPRHPEEGDAHPVRRVSWEMCSRLLGHYGLALPTEAQWEYAARAGSSSCWSTGWEAETLAGSANLADLQEGAANGIARTRPDRLSLAALELPGLDDGFARTAPVGSFAPNAFGLHDVHGNVMELVRDEFGPYTLPVRAGDGERLGGHPHLRIGRGGAWSHAASEVRSAARHEVAPDFRSYQGCRPVRPLER